MPIPNGERLVTKQDLADMYQGILPYLGGIVTSKAGFTPIGTIISVMGTTAPVNYLACDGTVYNIADYTELANYFNEQFGSKNFFGGNGTTTFAVPDLRGEFLRGTGTNSHANQGSGANVGVHQNATLINAPMNINNADGSWQKSLSSDTGWTTTSNQDSVVKSLGGVEYGSALGTIDRTNVNNIAKLTTRPTNTSVLYCIATKNFYIDPTLDYSTEEKIVGTWIDGSPVYQKTFKFKLTALKTEISIGASVEDAFVTYGYVNNGAGYLLPKALYLSGDIYINSGVHKSNNTVYIETNINELIGKDCVLVVQYTKTN